MGGDVGRSGSSVADGARDDAHAGPAALYTFLFTDIEGSSPRWLDHRAAMEEALVQHDRIVRAAVAAEGGDVFRTGGDGFYIAFQQPAAAARAAIAMQRALTQVDWSAVDGLRVRMALHTGNARPRAGEYFGPAPNRTARLISLAHGGQVLMTATTAELITAEREVDCSVRMLASYPLDDPQQPVGIYQLLADGLPQDFPPLRLQAFRKTNLPLQSTLIIGREEELAEVRTLLGEHRLVTLTGSGGIGKTRLALEVGSQALPQYADGVWLVELAPIASPDLVAGTVAAALGFELGNAKKPMDALVARLGGRRLLLILDNCEHLVDAAAALAEATLGTAPGVQLLATSQVPFGVSGEQAYRVPSLAVPQDEQPTAQQALGSGAVQLFVERAKAVDLNFTLDDRRAESVAAICRRLDGIPLAIEMAAVRAPMLGVDALAQKLDERFRLIVGNRRTALPRQQTLRATLDWSYGLLSAPERAVLRRLALFVGGFTLAAATALAADPNGEEAIDDVQVIDLLARLVARSLVVADTNYAGTRYRLLETTRAYGLEKLGAAGERETFARRHAHAVAGLFEQSFAERWHARPADHLAQYRPELDNLRAALDWASRNDPALEMALVGATAWLWDECGLNTEWMAACDQALGRVSPSTPPLAEARALSELGWVGRFGIPLQRAVQALERAITLYRETTDRIGLYLALSRLAPFLAAGGALDHAENVLAEAKALEERIWPPRLLLQHLSAHGSVLGYTGLVEEYRLVQEERCRLARLAQSELDELLGRANLVLVEVTVGRLDAALADAQRLVERCRQQGFAENGNFAYPLVGLAFAHAKHGDVAAAAAALREALPLVKYRSTVLRLVDLFALLAFLRGERETAARLVGGGATLQKLGLRQGHVGFRALHEDITARLREVFGPASLTRLLAEGEAMSEAELVALARPQLRD
ncbi:MAG TPA: adenylate/guanylate cyclase domain-containing protein [Burkholderiaceae bacterium]|nr:adenylate/guanylate cyclase domain-containing protein [Burkholderiaceae bacterium]